MKKIIALTLLAVSLIAGNAFAACTEDEAQKKAMEFATKMQELAQKDAQKAMAIAQDMQTKLPEIQKKANDIDAICAFYDELLKKL